MAYWRDHTGAARDFCRRFLFAAFEAAVEPKPRPGFGKLVPTPTIWHSVFTRRAAAYNPLLTVQTYPEWAGKISYRTLSCSAAFSSVSQPVVMPGTKALHASPSRTALPAGSCASIVTKAWVIFSTNAGSMSLCAVKQQ